MLDGGLLELVVGVDDGGVGGAEWLVGHRGPQKPDELAGDGDVRDGAALAVLGEVPVSVMEPDLGLPGALVGRPGRWRDGVAGGGNATPPRSAAGGRDGSRRG